MPMSIEGYFIIDFTYSKENFTIYESVCFFFQLELWE